MPWGVAGIRGTFWMNEVTATRQSTSVLDGRAEVTAAGRTVTVEPGQSAAITAPTAAPTPPAPMTAEERQAWTGARDWVEQRAAEIQEKAPVVTPPPPVTEQVPPAEGPPPPPVPPVVQNVIASLGQVTGASAPTAPRTGGGGGGGVPVPPPADTTPPAVVSTEPADGAMDVPVDATITVTFSEEVQAGSAYENIVVKDAAGNAVAVGKSIGGKVLTIVPSAGLAYGTTYTVTVPAGAVKDAAGNALAQDFVFRFTTRAAPPEGLAVVPVPDATAVTQGDEVAMEVRVLNVDGTSYPAGLYAADVTLVYEPRLELQYGADGKPAVIPAGAFADGLLLFPQAGAGQGQFRFVVTLTGPPRGLVGNVAVAKVIFTGKETGAAKVVVTAADLATVGPDGKPDPLGSATLGSCLVEVVSGP